MACVVSYLKLSYDKYLMKKNKEKKKPGNIQARRPPDQVCHDCLSLPFSPKTATDPLRLVPTSNPARALAVRPRPLRPRKPTVRAGPH